MKRVAVLLGVVLVGAGIFLLVPRGGECDAGVARIEAAFSPGRREKALTALLQLGTPTKADQLTTRVDRTRDALTNAWKQVCAPSGPAGPRRCLEHQLDQFEVVTDVLSAGVGDLRAAWAVASRLDDPQACLNGERLAFDPAPADPVIRRAIREARVLALTSDALRTQSKIDDAVTSAENALNQAHETHWPAVEAEAMVSTIAGLRAKGRLDEADAMVAKAQALAEQAQHDEVLIRLGAQRLTALGARSTLTTAEVEPVLRRVEETLARLPRARLKAEVDLARTVTEVTRGLLVQGTASSDAALAWATTHDVSMENDLHVLRTQLFFQHGRSTQALEEAKQASKLRIELLGAGHPLSLQAQVVLGEALARAGICDDAYKLVMKALIEVKKRNDLNPLTAATAMLALGLALEGQGQVAEALGPTREARSLFASVLGPTHRATSVAMREVGIRMRTMGRVDEAISAFTEAIDTGSEAGIAARRETLESRAQRALTLAMFGLPDARSEATAVLAACDADAAMGDGPRLTARLAIAFLADATPAERTQALELATAVRGTPHPDVLRALLLQYRAKDENAPNAGSAAVTMLEALQFKSVALEPLVVPPK